MNITYFKILLKKKFLIAILLSLIVLLSLYLRVILPYSGIMKDPIRYAADDGVYHLRIVENLLFGGHFPKKIYFDAFTYFPYGTYIHFAPLYDYLLAGIVWIFSFGRPTPGVLHKIAPFYPPVLGTLAVIVVFFIGKILWGDEVGLFGAFLMAISRAFLFRSILGATDHHQAETLFSSLAILFFILAMKNHKKKSKFLLLSGLTGISLGIYFLTWIGGLLFLFIFFLTIVGYYLFKFLMKEEEDWILLLGMISFSLAFLMILPFFGHPNIWHSPLYNITHLLSFTLGILAFLVLYFIPKIFNKILIKRWFLLIHLSLFGLGFLFLLWIVFPTGFKAIVESFQTINIGLTSQQGNPGWRKLARELIGEMHPLTLPGALDYFSFLFYLFVFGFFYFLWRFYKEKKPEVLFLLIWALVLVVISGIFFPKIGQNRFIYYLAVPVCLFSGFLAVKFLKFSFAGLREVWKERKEKVDQYKLIASFLVLFYTLFFVFYPFPFNLIEPFPQNLPKIIRDSVFLAKFAGGQPQDIYDTLKWLKENTPDPGVDYYALYPEPGIDKKTGQILPYPYPPSAYGILASWDLGHMITYYAHRIPNANPFQQGLGKVENGKVFPGETTFFIETDEKKATQMLDELKTKYIITDFEGAEAYSAFGGKPKWAKESLGEYFLKEENIPSRYYDWAMIVRLHFLDGREWWNPENKEETYIKYLDHFRLVYESSSDVTFGFFQDPKDTIKFMKVFEYVKGARVRGVTKPGEKVEILTEILTNQGRKFIYKKSLETKEDGVFEFVLPYSTFKKEGWLENGTKFAVFASPYKLKAGEKELEIAVKEEDVINGNFIEINL